MSLEMPPEQICQLETCSFLTTAICQLAMVNFHSIRWSLAKCKRFGFPCFLAFNKVFIISVSARFVVGVRNANNA